MVVKDLVKGEVITGRANTTDWSCGQTADRRKDTIRI